MGFKTCLKYGFSDITCMVFRTFFKWFFSIVNRCVWLGIWILPASLNMVFRTLLKSVFAILNRRVWLCVWVVPASPSPRVEVLKSPKCPVIRTKMAGIFPKIFIKSPNFPTIFELQPCAKSGHFMQFAIQKLY